MPEASGGMSYFHWIAGCILGLAWFSRLAGCRFGVPKIADISAAGVGSQTARAIRASASSFPPATKKPTSSQALTRLLALDYDNYEVIAVDDRSTDRTGEIMERSIARRGASGRLKVIHIARTCLPAGWAKPHAMWSAAKQATGDWLLFTDADVLFKPDALRRALAYAESERADHLVLFPRMIMKQPGREDDDRFLPDAVRLRTSSLEGGRSQRPKTTWAWVPST